MLGKVHSNLSLKMASSHWFGLHGVVTTLCRCQIFVIPKQFHFQNTTSKAQARIQRRGIKKVE